MDFEKLIAYLQKTDEGQAFAKQLAPHIEKHDEITTEIATLKEQILKADTTVKAVGERDISEVIALYDLAKKEGFDTAEKIVAIKAKADKLELTEEQTKAREKEVQEELDKGKAATELAQEESRKEILLSDSMSAMLDYRGEERWYKESLKDLINKGLISKSEDGKILYGKEGDRNPITECAETLRKEYTSAFKEPPTGTDITPRPGDPNRNSKTTNTMKQRMTRAFK
jgi:hypothetical protein